MSSPPPEPAGDAGYDASYEVAAVPGAGLPDLAGPPVAIELAQGDADMEAPAPSDLTTTVSTASAAPAPRPAATEGGIGIVERTEPPATVAQALDLRATASGQRTIGIATPPSQAVSAAATDQAPSAAEPPRTEGSAADPADEALSAVPDPLSDTMEPLSETADSVSDTPELVASPLSPAEIERLLARAEDLLRNGQITSARLLFQRIAAAGDRRGAKGVGMTYDPKVYERLAVTGATPDPEQAAIWYEKAGEDTSFTIDLAPPPEAVQAQAEPADTSDDALEPGSPEWNAACSRKYRSFEPDTGLYTSYGGTKRECRLP